MEFNIKDKCWFIIGHGIAKGEILDKRRTWQYNIPIFPITYTIKKLFSTSNSEQYYCSVNETFRTKKEAVAYIKKHFNCIDVVNYSNVKITYGK